MYQHTTFHRSFIWRGYRQVIPVVLAYQLLQDSVNRQYLTYSVIRIIHCQMGFLCLHFQRHVAPPVLVFCQDHNLQMCPQGSNPRIEEVFESEEEDQSSESSSSEDDDDQDLSF